MNTLAFLEGYFYKQAGASDTLRRAAVAGKGASGASKIAPYLGLGAKVGVGAGVALGGKKVLDITESAINRLGDKRKDAIDKATDPEEGKVVAPTVEETEDN